MLIIDTEIYSDYFLVASLNTETGKITHIEAFDGQPINKPRLRKLMVEYVTMSFNGNHFDLPLLAAAVNAGYSIAQLKKLADKIIKSTESIWRILKAHELRVPDWDHIDLIEVAPGQSSLKIYGGRLNAPKMQDLPIEPEASIKPEQRQIVREYCENDLHTTHLLYKALKAQIDLRVDMGAQYGMDFRSLSDAQIAEKLITHEMQKITGKEYRKPEVKDGFAFKYRDPKIIRFQTQDLQERFYRLLAERWQLGPNGSVQMPAWLKESRIKIGQADYQMGIGGLHSCEQRQCIRAEGDMVLADYDVASYYPSIIMQQQLAPNAFGKPFLTLYQSLIRRRLEAKRSGDKVTADTLKITLNGSFGKFGSKYSTLYAPELLIQTTITGQLALLMLIERLESAGVRVVSANTDGIVVYHSTAQADAVDEITFDWMLDTSYQLERTPYSVIASRDVNNYLAVRTDGKIKGKGIFAPASLAKNPDGQIIYTAVAQHIAKGTPIEDTIHGCTDLAQFVTIRRVQGGSVWRGERLGKAVRFYHSTAVPPDECIHYATNSNRVPNSGGARPAMELGAFPNDVNHDVYIKAAQELLLEVGYA
jgi:hypothetical protein